MLAALPDTLAGKSRRTDVGDGLGAIWGDPPLVLRCGVDNPEGFDPQMVQGPNDPPPCLDVTGVGWYLPSDERDGDVTATFTAVSYSPRVSLTVTTDDQPEGGAAALAELAAPVRQSLSLTLPCS